MVRTCKVFSMSLLCKAYRILEHSQRCCAHLLSLKLYCFHVCGKFLIRNKLSSLLPGVCQSILWVFQEQTCSLGKQLRRGKGGNCVKQTGCYFEISSRLLGWRRKWFSFFLGRKKRESERERQRNEEKQAKNRKSCSCKLPLKFMILKHASSSYTWALDKI